MFTGKTLSNGFGQLAATHGVFVVPTLSVLFAACGESDGPSLLADPKTAQAQSQSPVKSDRKITKCQGRIPLPLWSARVNMVN